MPRPELLIAWPNKQIIWQISRANKSGTCPMTSLPQMGPVEKQTIRTQRERPNGFEINFNPDQGSIHTKGPTWLAGSVSFA